MSDDLRREYVIGLGANLGDRVATLRSAVQALASRGRVLAVSRLYESPALGPPQPDYVNAAVFLDSALAPRALLTELLAIERQHGRERRERWGPRTLDLDLLHSPGLVLDEPDLAVPHPELGRRRFALAPLVDVAPTATDPRTGVPYAELLAALSEQGVRVVEEAAAWCPGRAE